MYKRPLHIVQKQLDHIYPIATANLYADVPFDHMLTQLNGLYKSGDD